MVTEISLTVNLTEIDRMGIVHHCNYPKWFEAGRRDFLKKAGASNSRLSEQGLFLPLSGLKCEYKSPARFNDQVIVQTSITYMSCVKIKFGYTIIGKKSNKIIATGETVHAWTNKRIEPVNMEKAAPKVYELLKKYVVDNER